MSCVTSRHVLQFNIRKVFDQLFDADNKACNNSVTYSDYDGNMLIIEQTRRLKGLDQLIEVGSTMKLKAWRDSIGLQGRSNFDYVNRITNILDPMQLKMEQLLVNLAHPVNGDLTKVILSHGIGAKHVDLKVQNIVFDNKATKIKFFKKQLKAREQAKKGREDPNDKYELAKIDGKEYKVFLLDEE